MDVSGCKDGYTEAWMGGCLDGWIDLGEWMDVLVGGCMDLVRYMDRSMNRWMMGAWMDGPIDGWMHFVSALMDDG